MKNQLLRPKRLALIAVLTLILLPQANAQSIFHPARLNWDFINFTGQQVNDFDIIVESPTFSPNDIFFNAPFTTYTITHGNYIPSHAGLETRIRWSGATVNPNALAHIGLDMDGAGRILDAYWTLNGTKVNNSLAITYESTEVRLGGSGAIHMQLQMSPAFFADHPSEQAGWENVRTFVNIPSSMLGLQDLTRSLDLATLSGFEVTPHQGMPGFPGDSGSSLPGQILMPDGDSFYDVFLAVVDDAHRNSGFESLLVADVVNQGTVVGRFWNLNSQCPEPSTLSLLALAGLGFALWRRSHR